MRLVFGLVLIAGLGLAGFAVYMAQNYIGAYETALHNERSKRGQAIPTQKIYVAKRTIAYGERIYKEDVALTDWPTKVLPEAYFNEENPLIVPGEAPRVALRTIEKYEAFMGVKVSEPGRDAGVLSQLSAGQSAVALRVDVASGVSGFLRPGDHVDVYWTGRLNSEISGQTGEVTRRVLSKVRVIGIDQSSAVEYGAAIVARTVTVAGNAEEVAKLQYAQQTGKLSLSLLARDAISETDVVEIDQRALLGLQDTVAAPVEAPKQKTCVTVERRGTERIEISRPCS